MSVDLVKVEELASGIDSFTDPGLSFEAEAAWKANAAYAKESRDYDLVVKCFTGWILQRRKTTELVQAVLPDPGAYFGNQHEAGNENVTKLIDFGFTKMQWHRRRREFSIAEGVLNDYLDECIEMTKQPTIHGLITFSDGNGYSRPSSPWKRVDENPPLVSGEYLGVAGVSRWIFRYDAKKEEWSDYDGLSNRWMPIDNVSWWADLPAPPVVEVKGGKERSREDKKSLLE